MTSSSDETEVTSFFAKKVLSVEAGEFTINEEATEENESLDFALNPSFDTVEREGEKCARKALEQFGGEISVGGEPACDAEDEGEVAFVDAIGDGRRDKGAELQGFTFTDALI